MILVIDTSTSTLTVGVATPTGELLYQTTAIANAMERGVHDAKLALTVKQVLEASQLDSKNISKIGIVSGPGSFTGLRIGFAFAKGFAFGTGASIVPISTHQLIAHAASGLSYDAIVTPGYQPSLIYTSIAGKANDIHPIELAHFLTETKIHKLIGPSVLEPTFKVTHKQFVAIEQNLAILAKLAAAAEGLSTSPELSALEPLYVTDFQTNR